MVVTSQILEYIKIHISYKYRYNKIQALYLHRRVQELEGRIKAAAETKRAEAIRLGRLSSPDFPVLVCCCLSTLPASAHSAPLSGLCPAFSCLLAK